MTLRQQDQLGRLRKSLEQYVERRGDLTYIGLIGHFSAGKSSLINSLLGAWSSQHERQTGLHPTDTVITLLTHHKNAGSLLGVSGGGSVPIRLQTLENDFLLHLVLADSPGTGDPHLIEEMARDFLPICDLILFVFSAASPIDETDLPTLRELHKRLPFIPLLFVVTRADELRLDKQQPLTESNFNEPKAAEFLAETLSRISCLLESSQYTQTHFVLVDNSAQFRIPELKTELLRRADPFSPSSRIAVHGHKIHYYLTSAKELRSFFAEFLNSKPSELRKIVTASEKNIQRYHESVTISNNNLTKSWFERYTALQDIRHKAGEQPAALADLKLTTRELGTVPAAITGAAEAFDRSARNLAERIADHVRLSGFIQVKDEFAKVVKAMKQRKNFDGLTVHSHGLGVIDATWSLDKLDLVPAISLSHRLEDIREATRECVNGVASSARQFINDLSSALNHRVVVEKCETISAGAQESLKKDLDTYFQSVQVDRAGVFSMGTKGSIAKLGIGDELAKLETEFTEEDKELLVSKAREELFPSGPEMLASVTTKLRDLADRVRPLDQLLKPIYLDSPPRLVDHIASKAGPAMAVLTGELENELQHETAQLVDHAQNKLAYVFGSVIDSYEKAIKTASRRRLWTYLITAGVCGLLGFSLTFGYAWLRRPAGQALGEVLLWSVAANLVADAIGLGIAWLRDNYPEAQRTITEHHLVQLVSQVETAVTELAKNHKFTCLDEASLSARLRKIFVAVTDTVAADAWQHDADKQFEILRGLYRDLAGLRIEYLQVVRELTQGLACYFDDGEKNLGILRHISEEVKDRAIQPSFLLLAETSRMLGEIKEEIELIEFTRADSGQSHEDSFG